MTDAERAALLETENNGLKEQVAKLTASANDAVKEALDRRAAIMALDEAKGREALAEHLFNAGNTVEAAKATLSVAPKADAGEEEYQPPRRMMNAENLNREPNVKPQAKGGLSARMDARAAKMKKS